MRVLIADDHPLMVDGLCSLLDAHGIEVAADSWRWPGGGGRGAPVGAGPGADGSPHAGLRRADRHTPDQSPAPGHEDPDPHHVRGGRRSVRGHQERRLRLPAQGDQWAGLYRGAARAGARHPAVLSRAGRTAAARVRAPVGRRGAGDTEEANWPEQAAAAGRCDCPSARPRCFG